jgi:arylamine N-acetyltransferase
MNRELGEIEAYYARIGYFGPREPVLAVLQSIVAGCWTHSGDSV